jgi:predicted transposase YdaD
MIQNYEYQSEYARRYVQQGREEGKAEGRAEGKAEGVLRVLEARGLSVPRAVAERILACRDLDTLDVWLTRAVIVTTADAIFE